VANLGGLLGTMLATGMGGRSRRGPAFGSAPFGPMGGLGGLAGGLGAGMGGGFTGGAGTPGPGRGGMGFRNTAGLAALGYLAYKAFQDRQSQQGGQSRGSGGGGGFGGLFGGQKSDNRAGGEVGGGPSLGDRLAGTLRQGQGGSGSPYPEADIGDERALLLIRAMIAAAAADGEISRDERRRILDKVGEAGAGPEETRILEREFDRPLGVDQLAAQVRDPETAEQVYLASILAIEPDSQAERTYLQYLAARLNLEPDQRDALHRVA